MAVKTSLSNTGTLTLSDIGSVYFPGTNDFLTIPSSANLAPGSGDFTIEAWVYPTAALSTYNVVYETAVTNGLLFGKVTNGYGIRNTGVADLISSPAPAINQWVHIAVTRSGTSLRIFIDGDLKNTVTDSTNFQTGQTSIGANIGGNNPFTGYISNLRFIKGNALYTTSFIPSTVPLNPVTNTQLLICQGPRIRDASSNNFAITLNNSPVYNDLSPFRPTLSESLIESGSIYFDGGNHYVTIPSSSKFVVNANQDFTMECWVYLSVQRTDYSFMVYFYDGSNILQFRIGNSGFGYRIQATFGPTASGSSVYDNVNYTQNTILNRWAHLALCRSGTTTRFFIDGVSVSTQTGVGGVAIGTPAANNASLGYASPYAFAGYLSNFKFTVGTALYTQNFTPSAKVSNDPTTQLLLKSASSSLLLKDDSINNFTLTATGTPTYSVQTPEIELQYSSAGSVYFDGSADYIDVASNSAFNLATNDFTLEFWINTTKTTDSWVTGYYASNPLVITNIGYTVIIFSGNYLLDLSSGTTETTFQIGTTTQISNGNWNHIACTRSSNVVRTFLNGVLTTSTAYSSTLNNPASAVYRIGGLTGTFEDAYFGYVSNLRLINGRALYTSNFIPSSVPLSAITNTSLLTCQGPRNTIRDASLNNFTITVNGNSSWSYLSPFSVVNSSLNVNGMDVKELDEVSMITGSILFDGVDDFLTTVASATSDLGTISTSTNFTFDCWARWNVVNTSSYRTIAVHAVSGSGGNGKGGWAISERSGILEFNISKTASTFNPWYVSFTTNQSVITTTSTWYHIAFVIASGVPKFYVNGVEAPSTFNTSAALYSSTLIGFDTTRTDYGVRIGATYTDSTNLNPLYFFSGFISNLRIVNGTALYTRTFTPQQEVSDNVPNTSLLLNCLSGQEFTDSSPNNFTLTRNGLIASSTLNPISTTSTAQKLFFDGTIMVREFVET